MNLPNSIAHGHLLDLRHLKWKGTEQTFIYAADGAYPVVRYVFKSSAGGNAVFGVADFRVVNVAAWITDIFLHFVSPS